jgi:hypothetical protein
MRCTRFFGTVQFKWRNFARRLKQRLFRIIVVQPIGQVGVRFRVEPRIVVGDVCQT